MTPTILIKEPTKQMLEKIKEIENKVTFDDAIIGLSKNKLNVPNSLFGKGKGKISTFKKEDKMVLHDLGLYI